MQTKQVKIKVLCPGLFDECEECAKRLVDGLKDTRGVEDVSIIPSTQEVTLQYDANRITLEQIYKQADALGTAVNKDYSHARLRISGLDCPDCAGKLETQIKRIKGVEWANLNFATSMLTVEYKTDAVALETIQSRIRSLGYDIAQQSTSGAPEKYKIFSPRLFATALSGLLLVLGLILDHGLHVKNAASILFVLSAIFGAIYTARYGVLALLGRALDTNTLMTAAAIGAIVLGEYSEAAAVMFLYSLGSTLESVTTDKTRRSIYSLIDSFPKFVHLKTESSIEDVKLEDVQAGQIVVIKPGERIPLDGFVKVGVSDVDESSITGESIPVAKEAGSQLYSGSLNGTGALEMVVSSIFSESTVSKVVKLVEEAQSQKAKSQGFTEVFGRIYTPIVLGVALLVAVLGPIIFTGTYLDWVHKALVLLVVSCPCALVISTPVAIVSAIGHLASKGVLVKGGLHLETLSNIKTVGFDKTGTITTGKLQVIDILSNNGYTPNEILSAAAGVESKSEHPISDAILKKAEKNAVEIPQVSHFQAIPGKGAMAVLDSNQYLLGNSRLMAENNFDTANINPGSLIGSIVYVANEEELMGAIVLSDTIRSEIPGTLDNLRKQGVDRIAMLTGDSKKTADVIAKGVGIDEVYAELLPEDKLTIVRKLAKEASMAMVGDGINDAPALAASQVGIAIRGLGNEAAVQSSDIVLMGDDLSVIPYAVAVSKKSHRIIVQNTAVALGTVAVLLLGTFLGFVGLAIGVFAHEGSALLVIANGMRLLKGDKTKHSHHQHCSSCEVAAK